LYGLAIMVYGVGGYVFPYFLADQWSLIIQAGIKATNDDAYRFNAVDFAWCETATVTHKMLP